MAVAKIKQIMDKHQNYKTLISEKKYAEALDIIDAQVLREPDNDRLLFERGKLKWRIGDRSGATGDYAKAVAINPSSPAAMALEQARDIADFFNPDLYNP